MKNLIRTGVGNMPKKRIQNIPYTDQMFLVAQMFFDFECLRKLRNTSTIKPLRIALNSVMMGYFFEMISTVKRFDPDGYKASGFSLTEEDLKILKGKRNMTFHIPDNLELFHERAANMLDWAKGDMIKKIYLNSEAFARYMKQLRIKIPDIEKLLNKLDQISG